MSAMKENPELDMVIALMKKVVSMLKPHDRLEALDAIGDGYCRYCGEGITEAPDGNCRCIRENKKGL